MQLHTACVGCQQPVVTEVTPNTTTIACPHCQRSTEVPPAAWRDGELTRCLVCPCHELFVRKDFPQQIGLTILIIGFALSAVAWYLYLIGLAFGILFVTAGIDLLLYLTMPEALVCYRCQAHYRAAGQKVGAHGGFDLAIHERYRQEMARLSEHQSKQSLPPTAS